MTTQDTPSRVLYLIAASSPHDLIYRDVVQHGKLQKFRFAQPAELLELHTIQRPACIVCDLNVGAKAADQLQLGLHERALHLPLIFVGVDPPFGWAVKAMERGALTVMCQPIQVDSLRSYVEAGLKRDAKQCKFDELYAAVNKSMEQMSERQQSVLQHVVCGLSTKQIALELGVSERLVEKERSIILELFSASSTSAVTLKLGGYDVIDALRVRFDQTDLNFLRVSVRRSGSRVADRKSE